MVSSTKNIFISAALLSLTLLLSPSSSVSGESLAGVDANNDGLRDDAYAIISASKTSSPAHKAALIQTAIAFQGFILTEKDNQNSIKQGCSVPISQKSKSLQ